MTRDQAKTLVDAELKRLTANSCNDADFVILDGATIERAFGWVFFYQSTRFLESGNPIHKLSGNAPYIVDRRDGTLHVTGTARPIDEYIAAYERGFLKGV